LETDFQQLLLMSALVQTVTFLFTDIEGSTRLWESYPDEMKAALSDHDRMLREIVASNDGLVFKAVGDGMYCAFSSPTAAALAAIAVQQAFPPQSLTTGVTLKVRVALHTGEAQLRDNDYFGLSLSRTARILDVGHGGQILCSQTTEQFLRQSAPASVAIVSLGSVRLKSLQRAENVFQIHPPDEIVDFPKLRSLEEYSHNLPVQLTSFVGREKELIQVRDAIQSSRLVTVTGPWGSGKTRIALQAAAELVEDFPRGVWLVEFASLTDSSLVPSALARVIGVREEPGRSLVQSIVSSYSGGDVLILLDNCEHVIDTVAHLTHELLASCANVKIIAISREHLNIPGETVLRIPPLPLPSENPRTRLNELLENESVRLFVERANAVQPKLELTDPIVRTIVQICRTLEGIPMALELAAARVSVMSVEQIAQRLSDRFRLLSGGGSRTSSTRQQTLSSTIDWSYSLLTESERLLLRRLTVFSNGWTLEAAEQICSGDGIDEWDLLDILDCLVNKSMVVADDQDGVPRHRLLESLRSYASAKRQLDDNAEAVALKHADWFVDLVCQFAAGLADNEQGKWLKLLDVEIDNLRLALTTLASHEPPRCLSLSIGLYQFWYHRGYLSEGRSWLSKAIELVRTTCADDESNRSLLARGINYLGLLQWSSGEAEDAGASFEKARALYASLGDESGAAASSSNLAMYAADKKDYVLAESLYRQSYEHFLRTDNVLKQAHCLNNLGCLSIDSGHYEEGVGFLEDAMNAFKEVSYDFGVIVCTRNISELYYLKRDFPRAIDYSLNGLALIDSAGDRIMKTMLAETLAFCLYETGLSRPALKLLAATESAQRDISYSKTKQQQELFDGVRAGLRRELVEHDFESCWNEGESADFDSLIVDVSELASPLRTTVAEQSAVFTI
jgi:predicted ATPase/class 3 adenylate cyclase